MTLREKWTHHRLDPKTVVTSYLKPWELSRRYRDQLLYRSRVNDASHYCLSIRQFRIGFSQMQNFLTQNWQIGKTFYDNVRTICRLYGEIAQKDICAGRMLLGQLQGIYPKTIDATKTSPLPNLRNLSPERKQRVLWQQGQNCCAGAGNIRIVEVHNPTTNAAFKEELRRGELCC